MISKKEVNSHKKNIRNFILIYFLCCVLFFCFSRNIVNAANTHTTADNSNSACIIQSVYPISCSDWSEERENHCVDLSYKELKERYKNPHAWVLADVKSVENVWYYDHPNGAVIWVKDVSPLDEMQDERLRYGY